MRGVYLEDPLTKFLSWSFRTHLGSFEYRFFAEFRVVPFPPSLFCPYDVGLNHCLDPDPDPLPLDLVDTDTKKDRGPPMILTLRPSSFPASRTKSSRSHPSTSVQKEGKSLCSPVSPLSTRPSDRFRSTGRAHKSNCPTSSRLGGHV